MLRLVVFLALLAAVVYACFWLLDRRRTPGPETGGTGGRTVTPRPMGPDDDEDFLRELERKRRHTEPGTSDDEG